LTKKVKFSAKKIKILTKNTKFNKNKILTKNKKFNKNKFFNKNNKFLEKIKLNNKIL